MHALRVPDNPTEAPDSGDFPSNEMPRSSFPTCSEREIRVVNHPVRRKFARFRSPPPPLGSVLTPSAMPRVAKAPCATRRYAGAAPPRPEVTRLPRVRLRAQKKSETGEEKPVRTGGGGWKRVVSEGREYAKILGWDGKRTTAPQQRETGSTT